MRRTLQSGDQLRFNADVALVNLRNENYSPKFALMHLTDQQIYTFKHQENGSVYVQLLELPGKGFREEFFTYVDPFVEAVKRANGITDENI